MADSAAWPDTFFKTLASSRTSEPLMPPCASLRAREGLHAENADRPAGVAWRSTSDVRSSRYDFCSPLL